MYWGLRRSDTILDAKSLVKVHLNAADRSIAAGSIVKSVCLSKLIKPPQEQTVLHVHRHGTRKIPSIGHTPRWILVAGW